MQWRAFEPGEWDCRNRDDVLRVIRERYEQGFSPGALELINGAPDQVIGVSRPREIGGEDWPEETATIMTFRNGTVTEMRDYRSKDEALSAIA